MRPDTKIETQWEGEPWEGHTWAEFADANPDDASDVERDLEASGIARLGGGAAPVFTIRFFSQGH